VGFLQVSPPDVTGAQLAGSGVTSPSYSPRPGSIGEGLLGNHTRFPTVEDMPQSPTGSDDYHSSYFQPRPHKSQHVIEAIPLLPTNSQYQNDHRGTNGGRSHPAGGDSGAHVHMKPIESGARSLAANLSVSLHVLLPDCIDEMPPPLRA
jgi:hypothetical protein